MSELGRNFYWIVSRYGGRLVIIGPKNSEEEASEYAYSVLDMPFEVVPLDTRDRGKATSQIKAMRLSATADLGASLQRARHAVPAVPNAESPGGDQWGF